MCALVSNIMRGANDRMANAKNFMPYSFGREMTEEEMQSDYDRRLQQAINVMKVYTAEHNALIRMKR